MKRVPRSISVVIPVFNEARHIERLLARVLKADTLGLTKQVIVVDDGSTDNTVNKLSKINHKSLQVIYLPKNVGKGTALRVGFGVATGDLVLVQDADLEYDPSDYKSLVRPFVTDGADVVFGSRELTINKHSYPIFFLGGKLITSLTRLLFGGELTDVPTGYKVFRRKLLLTLPLKCKRFEFCPEVAALLLKKGIKIVEVPITYRPRTIAQGKKIRYRDGIEAILTLLRVRVGL